MEKTILVFDICSSTSILEDLHRTNSVDKIKYLFSDINKFLKKNTNTYNYGIYKFLGDGYVLIFNNENIDSIIEFTIALTYDCNMAIDNFIKNYVEAEESISRKGITCGIDKGIINNISINGVDEYIGRPINSACRLQASLNLKEHTNKVLFSKKIYKEIKEVEYKNICSDTTRNFKNLANNEKVTCYEFTPLYFIKKDKHFLRKVVLKNLNKNMDIDLLRTDLIPKVASSSVFNVDLNYLINDLKNK